MGHSVVAEKAALSGQDWSLVAEWIREEKDRRKTSKKRRELERLWRQVDRQVALEPDIRRVFSGKRFDWFPEIELPLQFNSLEVNAADARRLKFPRGAEWYAVSANISAKYEERFQERRERFPMIGKQPLPMKMNQETANTLTKAVMDHYHKQWDFRAAIDLFDIECLKYGTGVVRTKEVTFSKFFNDFRGTRMMDARGPKVIPTSIWSVLLDDTPSAIMHEGIAISPGHIRCLTKRLADLKKAIRAGGPERGWRMAAVRRLEADKGIAGDNDEIEFTEYEGDLVVPRGRGEPIFLPGATVTIATGRNMNEVVRFLTNDYPFNSYDIGHYMRDSLDSPYGVSPLMKGQPIQEAATLALNLLLATSALEALPPCSYDRNDPGLSAKQGPDIYPGAMNAVDSPEAIQFKEGGDVPALTNSYLALLKQYEDLSQVNDPRRGGPVRSHTTAAAIDIEQSRGMSRVDDFVQGQLYGPITSILYKEFEIAKRTMKSPQDIQIDQGGVEGWLKVAAADLPDEAAFTVFGAAGLLNDRQNFENFSVTTNMALQIMAAAAQLGQPIPADFQRMILEAYRRGNINNASSFIGITGGAQGVPAGAAPGAALPPGAPGLPTNTLTGVEAAVGV